MITASAVLMPESQTLKVMMGIVWCQLVPTGTSERLTKDLMQIHIA